MDSVPYESSKNRRPITDRNGVLGKECVYCGTWKPLEGGFTKGPYDGKDHRCRECKRVKKLEAKEAQPIGDTPRQIGYAMLRYEGAEIAFEMDRSQVSLTDLWIAAGRPGNKDPRFWLYQESTKELLAQYAQQTNSMLDTVCGARQGNHGGTWAPREIALAYAMYLNPALHLAVLKFVLTHGQSSQAPLDLRNQLRDAMRETAHELLDEMRPWWSSITDIHHETRIEVRGVVYLCKYPRMAWPDSAQYYAQGWDRYAIGWTTKLIIQERLEEYPGKYDIQSPEELYIIKTDNPKLEGLIHKRRPRHGVEKVAHKKDVFWMSPEATAILMRLPDYLSHDEAFKRLHEWAIVRKGTDIKW